MDDNFDNLFCVSGSKLIKSGFLSSNLTDNLVKFINAGGETVTIKDEGDSVAVVECDSCFEGGDVLRTEETVIDGGELPSIYQSARFGNFSYRFCNLSPGSYLVDLHFAEIVNTNGPKGMRVFDVFMQEEKVLSEFDIYSIIGANKALQVVDVKVSVGKDGVLLIRFDGICGSPMVSAICIKRTKDLAEQGLLVCNHCGTEIEVSSTQQKLLRLKLMAKYEKTIEELRNQCQLKTDECYEAWMSLTAANEALERVRVDLDNKSFEKLSLDQAIEKQSVKFRELSTQYECDKRLWVIAIHELGRKIKAMKEEQCQLSCEAHECVDSIPGLNKMVYAVQALIAQCDDLKLKLAEEQENRKRLYNQLQEAKGNIRVFCRCRPLSKEEVAAGCGTVVDFTAAKDGELALLASGSAKRVFKFDRVYTPKDDQVDVFADASPLVISVLDGYNVCIFAYGQTGSGKTFTMEGTEENRGVNYRTLEQLFRTAEERKGSFRYNIFVSVLEVYNEQIRDLLASSPTSKKLEVRQASEGVHHVPGITEARVENINEVWDVLQAGSNARVVGSNNINEHSSRSHCMLCISVKAMNLMNGECTKSKLWLVDLAGSERLAKTEAQGERLKEAQNINRSLSALGDVISSLATKSGHVPYRNSKLTHLLQDSLGGDSKTLMFLQISPSGQDVGETLSSLNFATRVRGVELGPAKKQIDTGEIQKLKQMLEKTKQELRSKDEALQKLEENVLNLECKAKGKDQLCKSQLGKVNELESRLDSKTELCRLLEKQVVQLSEGIKGKEEVSSNFQRKVKELENTLKERTRDFEAQSGILQQKIVELEVKLRQQKSLYSPEKIKSTPLNRIISRMENIHDTAPPDMRCLNSNEGNNRGSSDLLKGTDSLRELRRKRQNQSKGSENNLLISTPVVEPTSKGRQMDPSKAIARITRFSKSVSSSNQRVVSSYNRSNNRDQVLGSKEGSNKLKLWLR